MKRLMCLGAIFVVAFAGTTYGHDGVPEASTGFGQPLSEYNSTNGYAFMEWSSISGCYHPGADYNGTCPAGGDCDLGLDVLAVAKGKVVDIFDNSSFGLCLTIEHRYYDTTVYSQYAHLQSVLVTIGDNVDKGDHVAELGNDGTSCGVGKAHLHWEIRIGGNEAHPDPHNADYWNPGSFQSRTNIKDWYQDAAVWCDKMLAYSVVESKFADVIQRNGSSNVGNSTNDIHWFGPYLRRDFSGGIYGNCCIMFDPYNQVYNDDATNEAYLLRTGFYSHYDNSQEPDGKEWKQFGCPSRDEYHPETGADGDAIQFFVQREWFPEEGETHDVGKWHTNFHYMYFEANLPTNQDPVEIIRWHSSYSTEWVSQTPSGKFAMMPGQTRQVTVQYRNTGQFTWSNNVGSNPYNYICLKSVGSNGAVTESFFNYPVDGSLGWIDTYTPCTMQQSSVAPGQTATFTFTIKVPSNATPGIRQIYFRPYHSTGGLLDDWGGMHFYHYTVVEGVDYDFDGDGIADYWDRTSTGEFHLDYASNNLTEWDTTFYGYGGSNDDPAPADYDGDGKYDFAILKNSNSIFYIDYARNGFGAWDDSLGGYGVAADYPCPGDYDGDKVDDISVRDADGDWHIDYFAQGNGFGAWDVTYYGYGGSSDRPAPADYNGDGKCDFAILRNSDRKFLIDYAPGFGSWDVTNLGGYGGFADYPCPADYDNDGSDDIAVLNTTDRALRVDRTGNGFNGWDYVLGGYGGSGDRPMPADYDGDGWDDVATYYAAYDQICLDYASNNYGSWDWCDDGPQHPTWKVATQTEPATLPLEFSVSQNYPNPFNPVTNISYSLPSATHVTLEVLNILGQRVELLVNADLPAGNHTSVWEADKQASGIYFYRLRTEDADVTKKMLLLK